MTTESVRSPRKKATPAVAASSSRTALRNWRPRIGSARARWVRTAFGPAAASRRAASAALNPEALLPSRARTSSAGNAAASSTGRPARGAAVGAPAVAVTPGGGGRRG